MSAHANPDIVTDGLAFIYDTGSGKSYKGEPTVNLTTDSPSQGGWNGSLNVLDSSTKKFRFNVSNFSGSPGQGWRSFTWDLNSYSGQSVTISATVEVPSASPGTFAWIMMGQGNTHTNTSGAGGYMGYSSASERIQKTTTTTEHITWSGTVGSTGTASQPSGHVGFTVWYNDGTPSTNSYVEVSNVQIEIKSHATPFVNGTRSATQGLIDRTNNTTINLSNVSFDSNAQMVFDGTDDYTSLGNPTALRDLTSGTIETVYYRDASSGTYQMVFTDAGSDLEITYLGNTLQFYIGNSGLSYTHAVTDQWFNVVGTWGSGFKKLYINGVEVASGTNTGTDTGNRDRYVGGRGANFPFNGEIPIAKIYNKALTSAEVLQNYNATKGRFQ